MFSPRKRPLLLVADRLLSLRLSLNTPVVATPDLPAGPARAAIAVHSEAGRTCFTVAVRSLRNGDSVLYELEGEDPNDASGIAVALDAALSFGESMGFLFDDELVTERREPVLRGALRQLREIVAPPSLDGETLPPLAPEPPAEEILLDEVDELAPEAAPLRAVRREPPAPPPSPPAPASRLTKFRTAAASGDEPPERTPESADAPPPPETTSPGGTTSRGAPGRTAPGGGALLGRVKPVRLRASDAPAPISALLRLLSWF